jgi:hypothetical protein
MRLGELLDQVSHLATTPVFNTVDLAATGGNDALVAFDHRGHLLALIRMDDKYYFIVTHKNSFWTDIKIAHPGVKTSVGRGKPKIIPRPAGKLNSFKRLSALILRGSRIGGTACHLLSMQSGQASNISPWVNYLTVEIACI